MKRFLLLVSPLVLASLAVLLLVSCTPAWLPDSSGFVFTHADGSVVLYDLKTKAQRQILPPGTIKPFTRLAVSPDGKRIGAAVLSGSGNTAKLQVLTFDLNGKQLHASPPHPFDDVAGRGAAEVAMATCYFSPDGKRLLAAFLPPKVFVVYEFGSKKFTRYADVTPPATAFGDGSPWLTDVTPFLPDGSGFVARDHAAEGEDRMKVVAFDGEGERPIDTSGVADKLKAAKELAGAARPPSWQDGQLVLPLGRGLFRLDPHARRLTYAEDAQMAVLDDYALKHEVRVLAALDGAKVLQMTKEKHVQVTSTDGGAASTRLRLGDEEVVMLQPAPDGRHFVLQYFSAKQPKLLVVDSAGDVVAEIAIQGLPK